VRAAGRWAAAALGAAVGAGCPEGAVDAEVELNDPVAGRFAIDRFEFPNKQGQLPLHGVTLAEAVTACAERGEHLCTAAEWRAACRGADSRVYPWGDQPIPQICNLEGAAGHTSLVSALNEDGNHPAVAQSGAFLECRTPEGVHDLAGNLEEWVQDDWLGRAGSLEGGAWYTKQAYAGCSGDYSRAADYRLEVDQPVGSAGFRCCRRLDGTPPEALRGRDAALRSPRSADPVEYDPGPQIELGGGRRMDRGPYPNRVGALPLLGVSQVDAAARCAAVGRRLCTAAEWESACAGPENTKYPYGGSYRPGACAVDRAEPAPVGAFLACEAASGALDLVGNGWEWTSTPVISPTLEAGRGPLALIRGGGLRGGPERGVCRPADGYPAWPVAAPHPELGFRCCDGPPPPDPAPWPAVDGCPAGMVGLRAGGRALCIDADERGPGGVDAAGAAARCATAGARLCAEAEWAAACGGPTGRLWATGDGHPGPACNLDGAGPWSAGAGACVSPEGVRDLSGDLWEWVEGPAGPVLRGGGWLPSAGLGRCAARATAPAGARGLAEWGVRCCADL